MNSAFVGYEELSRSRRVLSTSADNTLLNLLNSSYPTQPHSLTANYSRSRWRTDWVKQCHAVSQRANWNSNWNLPGQEIAIKIVYSRQQKIKNFSSELKTIMDNYWWLGSVLYYYFGCSSDRRCHHSKQYWRKSCRNSNRTFLMTMKSSSRLRE